MLCSNYLRFFIDTTLFNLHSIDLQHSQMETTPMSRVLIIESSARQQDSVSRQLTQTFIKQWQAAHPNDQITVRDLAVNPVPHLDANLLGGWMKPAEQRNAANRQSLDRSNELTDELLAADVLVMAAPMYNFAIPSTLKAWLDHVLRAGVTFKYTETGPQGLLTGKRHVLTARGGIYAGPADHQEPYLRQVMGFIGIHDVTFIHAEGMNLGGDFREGLNQANAKARSA
jgi:FMN-dependent NADH-azoreductase